MLYNLKSKIYNIFNNRTSFLSNTFMQYLMTLATYVFPLITFPYFTRILEPKTYGVITFITATMTYLQLLVDFGFNLSATKDIAENQTDEKYIGVVLGTVTEAKMFLLLLSFVIYSVLIFNIPLLKKNILLSYLYFGPIILSVWIPDYLFRGIEQMGMITVRFVASKTVATVLTFVLVLSPKDVMWIPILNILASLITVALTWYQIKKRLKINIYFVTIHTVKEKLQESFIYFVSSFATTAYGAINTVMIGVLALPAEQIAYWGVSYTLITAAQFVFYPVINSLYPHMAARRDFDLVKMILKLFMPAIIVTTIAVFYFAAPIILFFSGKNYAEAVPVFRAMLFVLVFSFPAMVIGFPVLGVIGKVKQTTTTTILSGIFHVVGLFLLAFVGKFTVVNIAILRSCTEGMLLGTRMTLLVRYRSCFFTAHTKTNRAKLSA
ncbi:MAG: oligosaccharide flippase family protein [Negativicutes bacterium]|nr:oligosaccharide flippase family protein [Negativicutes bacterium]